MQSPLALTVARLNRIKRLSHIAAVTIKVTRALVLAVMAIAIWSLVKPGHELSQFLIGLTTFFVALLFSVRRRERDAIQMNDLILALEMKYPDSRTSPSGLREDSPPQSLIDEWQPRLDAEVAELTRFERSRTFGLASTLVLPLAVSFVTIPKTAPSLTTAFSEVSDVVARLGRGASLKVLSGATTELPKTPLPLSPGKLLELELLAQNLIEIRVEGGGYGQAFPVVELRHSPETALPGMEGTLYQSFQMMPERSAQEEEDGHTSAYSISFAVGEPVDVYIPSIDADEPLARIKVKQLPVPKVSLIRLSADEDPWPDDQPLALQIDVKAQNPLDTVRLVIRSGGRVSQETVANVLAEDKLEVSSEYRLVLEPYVESDFATVEIIAEAVDRAIPTPLVGQSRPLRINTASAYGRYRQTLQTLRKLKSLVDEALGKQEAKLGKEAAELASKAARQSERSPFFDGLDRVQIHRFEARVNEIDSKRDVEALGDLSEGLNDFLFEHEILDDRERDRDFFVAARSLSRLIEQKPTERPVDIQTVSDRIRKFLDEREQRWKLRVERLSAKPRSWPKIRDGRPFHRTMDQIAKLEQEAAKGQAKTQADQLKELSQTVVDYRSWIEELEAKEDEARQEEERKRQQGLASARNELRELQQRQGEVSKSLDRAAERSTSELSEEWPSNRMKQAANAKATRRLENQLRSLSPGASARMKAALEAMESTMEAGDGQQYALAESSSDLAGRLLRQADRAARQSQEQRRSRGRRRRVTGDNYYGQSVVGGDIEIKREYQVDRRYREDILDEVQGSPYQDENRALLENYLRQVIR